MNRLVGASGSHSTCTLRMPDGSLISTDNLDRLSLWRLGMRPSLPNTSKTSLENSLEHAL